MTPIFVSGPHGSGKTTLIKKLTQIHPELFIENDFDIDLFTRFPSFENMNHFEQCLIKLYHRYIQYGYIIQHSSLVVEKTILVSRSIYDAIAYIETYIKLNIISKDDFNFLASVYNNIKILPYVIVLNPDVNVITHRLDKRRLTRDREDRDRLFAFEDEPEFLEIMHGIFKEMQNSRNIKYIVDNDDLSINNVLDWIEIISK